MANVPAISEDYTGIRAEIVALLQAARAASARSVNALMTATYWEIGRRIAEFEQRGEQRADYGEQLIEELAKDLTRQFGRGFGRANLWQMRAFYRAWPNQNILQTLARPFSKRKLFRATRVMWPALAALTVTSIAHAQGTMDFSGTTTLMTTFNMGAFTIQSKVVFSNPVQIISKQPVRAFDRQRESIRNLKQHAQCGMVSCTTQVREQVLRDQFATFGGKALAVV